MFQDIKWAETFCNQPRGFVCKTYEDPSAGDPCFNHKNFAYFEEKLSWVDARASCQAKGGDLASTHSELENMCAAAILPKSADVSIDYAWIGLQEDADSGSFGPWSWVDGTPMDYMNHNDDYLRKEDLCGLMHSDFQESLGEWDDGECDSTEDVYPYLCKDIDQ